MNTDIENLQVFNDAIINYTGGDLYTEDDDKPGDIPHSTVISN